MNSPATLPQEQSFTFDNRFVAQLPADPIRANHARQVHRACYSFVAPAAVENPQTVAYSAEVATLLGLSETFVNSAEFPQTFSGNQQLDGMTPYAMCYGGHQFGNWAGQLGDGRAINLGELVNKAGEHWALQLKGAGRTPYSRRGDGLAVLRSSIREFLCSEAMHHLGVPTTRALSLVTSGEQVMRDVLYNGNAALEPGAIVCRIAPSFTRFGNFQIFAARRELDVLRELADYTIRADFPELGAPAEGEISAEIYTKWFREVCRRTATMIVEWMRVGFVHGVMNTDNMSILGLTIDYGPYGWLDNYDPNWTPNTTDSSTKRYRFGQQPQVAHWNLAQLANALVPLFESVEPLQEAINAYAEWFTEGYQQMMVHKLGLPDYVAETDAALVDGVQDLLTAAETDMTIFFRRLADISAETPTTNRFTPLLDAYYQPDQLTDDLRQKIDAWLIAYQTRLQQSTLSNDERRALMNRTNPKYVLRNYMAQLAIDQSETGDHTLVWELLDLLRHPYDEQPTMEKWAAKRPDWARHRVGCSMLSCSS
ncbi:MAG: protein adenylyltransferase SelO [Candidatus Promineifilaceae bacterium]